MAEVLRISGWSRKVSSQGVVYYTKRGSNESRWIHPGLSQLIYSLSKFDNIRYAAYRLSSKLLEVQVILGSSSVSLPLTQSVLVHHGYSSPSLVLDSQELREFLNDLYIRAARAKGGYFSNHVSHEISTEAMASFVEQILDPAHQGGVTVLGLKTVLAVMTSGRLRERLQYLFREHSDHQARISETGLTYLLSILSRIPEILGEGIMFGSGVVSRGVRACLQAGGGRVVTEEVWMAWASREPPELVWLTTSYRQQASLKVQHWVKCSSCQSYPLVGMRYQCLQCLSYDMCQNCFFIGMSTKGHKPKHPVQEYCYPSTKKEEAKAFFATIVNKFKARQNQPKARKKVTRTLTADRSRPNSIQSNKSSQSKFSQLLIKVSPRSSIGESKSSPRSSIGDAKSSPSSGFCSGEECESPSGDSSPISNSHNSDENSPIYEPLIEEPVMEVDSPNLEWDDNGIELGDSALFPDKDIIEQLDNFENSIFRKDIDTGDIMCYQHNTKRVQRQDQMASIIGHIEEDHKKLQTRLEEASPELVQPVIEAQAQLNRLKDLMHNIFGSRTFLNDSVKDVKDRMMMNVQDNDLEYEINPNIDQVDEHRVTLNDNDDFEKPAESTRLEVFKNIQTPRVKFRGDNIDNFSPITSYPRTQEENQIPDNQINSDDSNLLLPPEKCEEPRIVENPVITFNCISSVSTSSTESDDPSLTKYNLSDLSHRMGGTGLYISRDNGLDITDQLDDKNDKSDSRYADTVDELEKLMMRLSSVFDTFRDPNGGKGHVGENQAIFGLVNGINEDLYGVLAQSKESSI